MKIGFVYSGQGAQYLGMGQELYDNFSVYRNVVAEASEALSIDMRKLCFEEEEFLNQTEYTQPAILTMSMATQAVLEEMSITPEIVAGLSLGEYSALVASGALQFSEAVQLVRKRGRFMTEAVPNGVGAMSAIMGLQRNDVEEACLKARVQGVVIAANYNMPGQIAIAGEIEAVRLAEKYLDEAGARKIIPLKVSGPFHTELLKPAAVNLEKALSEISINEMSIPVISNVNGKIISSKDLIAPTLVKQVQSPVYWEDCVETMIELGVDTFIEVGPGKTLKGFIKKINKQVSVENIENLKTLEKVKKMLAIA